MIGKKIYVKESHRNDLVNFREGMTGTILAREGMIGTILAEELDDIRLPLAIRWDHKDKAFHDGDGSDDTLQSYWHRDYNIKYLRYMNHKPVTV